MSDPVTFQRIYPFGGVTGPEHPATPSALDAALRSLDPGEGYVACKVLVRFSDGSTITVSPKKRKPK